MQLQTKKIIAREFILLIITLVITILAFLGIFVYNFYQNNKAAKLKNIISNKTSLANSLAKTYNYKLQNQKSFYDKFSEKLDVANHNSPDKLWKRLSELSIKDSIKTVLWVPEVKEIFKAMDFDNPEKLNSFIANNLITQADSSDFSKADVIYSELSTLRIDVENTENKIVRFDNQIHFAVLTFLISLIILFCIRYLFYAIKWSVKILKQKQ